MKAEARDLTFLTAEGAVRIPFFQREYVWSEENWEELLGNLADSQRVHFLGSLILKQQPRQSGSASEVHVIDGQQRLTTLSLLLKALYDGLASDVRVHATTAIRSVLFFKRTVLDAEFEVKIQHSHVDRGAFERVIRSGLDTEPLGDQPSESRVIACYRYFAKQLAGWTAERRRALFTHLLDQQNKMLVVIDLAEADNEQAIFDTINSAGVRLSGSDIIKNALYQRAISLLGLSDAVRLYDETWKAAFLGDEERVSFWGTERLTGRLKRDNAEILLHAFAVINGFYDPDKDVLSDLDAKYKGEIQKLVAPADVRRFAKEICEYARTYRKHFVSLDTTTPYSFDDDLLRLFHVLDAFQVSTLHPYVLFALRQPPERVGPLLRQLERFVVRRVVAGGEMRSLNKLAKELIAKPEALSQRESETSDDQVSKGLQSISNKTAAVLLFWIELRRRAMDPRHDLKALPYNFTLEHIIPQKWQDHWGTITPRKREDGSEMSARDLENDRAAKIYWLGNMTLLTASLNSALRHGSFERKIEGEGRKKGVRTHAMLTVTQDIIEEFDRDATWDESKIETRTERLKSEFLAIWPGGTSLDGEPAS